jgi:XTP/dITP diphosphohydrolase
MPRLLIASANPGKVREFRDLLEGCGWDIVAPGDIGLRLDVSETGTSYAENARLKAEAFSRASELAAIADDSGLEVDALNGEPGALHHLHGWDGRDSYETCRILLEALRDVPPGRRAGRYRAVLVLCLPDGRSVETQGVEEGIIATEPRGHGGFGYDPVFYLPELSKTIAELSIEEKNRVSHRAIAARKMRNHLKELAKTVTDLSDSNTG